MTFRPVFKSLFLLLLVPAGASAQSITTIPLTPVPVGGPWVLLALAMLLIGGAWWILQRRSMQHRHAGTLVLVVAAALGGSLLLDAQTTIAFSNPAGETLSIPIQLDITGDDVYAWVPAVFTNTSGVDLVIAAIDTPDLTECFPGGLDGVLNPGASGPSPHPLCAVNDTLASGATCRVDVETICRAAAEGNLASLTSITPTSGPASGGTGVTLSGTNLGSVTGVTFDGVPATSVTALDASTVTAVTPAHAVGVVDVAVTTPVGRATLAGSFTYATTVIGDAAFGGTIADLDGGVPSLIAATVDQSTGIAWGDYLIYTGAIDEDDGAANTATIITLHGENGGTPYAAQLCAAYEIDSQGNAPCVSGNACYNDWVLPASNQVLTLRVNYVAIGGFATPDVYWASTEDSGDEAQAFLVQFGGVTYGSGDKSALHRVRCVREQ